MDDQQVTLGEVYRLCMAIRRDVQAQNGRVGKMEATVAVLSDRDAQGKDLHARAAGWGGVLTAALSLWWAMFHSKP